MSTKNKKEVYEMAKRLFELRESKGLTQEKMAEKMDLSIRTYQRREHGDCPLNSDEIITLKKLFDIDVAEFLTGMTKEDTKEVEGLDNIKIMDEIKQIKKILQQKNNSN